MNDLTFNVLKIVVTITTALIALYLVPYIKNKLKDEKYCRLVDMVQTAVYAAEQAYKGQTGMGRIKKEDVIIFIQSWMLEHNINITDKQLSELIEAAVFEMNLSKGDFV